LQLLRHLVDGFLDNAFKVLNNINIGAMLSDTGIEVVTRYDACPLHYVRPAKVKAAASA
jgi:hypothetical protein